MQSDATREDLLARLSKLEAAVVADVLVAMGLESQVLAPELIPLHPHCKMAGQAVCASGDDDPDSQALATFELDEAIGPGSIVLIQTHNCRRGAVIGENMAASMQHNGALGFIVEGGIRDADAFIERQIPMFHRFSNPINAHKFWHFTAINQTITLPGVWQPVTVYPGDWIIADQDGVTVIPQDLAEQVIADAEIHMQTEQDLYQAITSGEDRRSATQRFPKLKHVKKITTHSSQKH